MSDIETRLKEIDEMVADYSRAELNDIAYGHGLDTIAYPNKRTVAEAILKERESSAFEQGAPEEPPVKIPDAVPEPENMQGAIPESASEEVESEVVMMTPNTVRSKVRSYKNASNEYQQYAKKLVDDGSKELQSGISQFNESLASFMNSMQDDITKFNHSVSDMVDSITSLNKKYETYNKTNFTDSINLFHGSVDEFTKYIDEHISQTRNYIKKFYG